MPRPHVATLLPGDYNLTRDRVNELAAAMGANVAHGAGPDYTLFHGAQLVDVRILGKHGSDAHQAILFIFEIDDVETRILLWNVWVGQRPEKVRAEVEHLTKVHDPDVVVLIEAYRCRRALRGLPGYRRPHQGPNVGEGADVAILVSRRHQVLNRGRMVMRRSWVVVSKKRTRAGREFPFTRIRLAHGPLLRLLGYHGPTDHPVNDLATREANRRIIRWALPRQKESR